MKTKFLSQKKKKKKNTSFTSLANMLEPSREIWLFPKNNCRNLATGKPNSKHTNTHTHTNSFSHFEILFSTNRTI